MTRVLIVAPSAVIRAGLESLLGSSPRLVLAGSVPNMDAAFDAPDADVLLLDLDRGRLPFDAAGEGFPPTVLLVGDRDIGEAIDAIRSGVRAVLPREVSGDEIVAAIDAVAAGLIVVHPALSGVLEAHGETERSEPAGESLTPREIEVLAMLAEGTGNKAIAHRLGISEHTVKFHVGSILAKLGATSRTEAVTLGVRRGLIML